MHPLSGAPGWNYQNTEIRFTLPTTATSQQLTDGVLYQSEGSSGINELLSRTPLCKVRKKSHEWFIDTYSTLRYM